MDPIVQTLVSVLCAVIASSGFWAYMQKRHDRKDAKTELLIGMAHDRIMYLCRCYIEQGWITQDEYENLRTYLYDPYKKNGGNGSAERNMKEVDKLPIRPNDYQEENG